MAHPGNLDHILFLDIETVPARATYDELTLEERKLFEKKTAYQRKDRISASAFYERAGIWAEFGKIICISAACIHGQETNEAFTLKSFYGRDEKTLLLEFSAFLNESFNRKHHLLCAHNGKEFDFPFLARRMVIHRIELPEILNLMGKKPWQIRHLDTMEMWKFGDYKHFTSLELLTSILNIPSPKDDLEGSLVGEVYYQDDDLDRIVRYCERDVMATARVYLRLKGVKWNCETAEYL